MSGPLENMSSLAGANYEVDLQQKLNSPALWRRLELHRLAVISSSSGERDGDAERKLVLGLLKDVEPRLLFVAVDFSYGKGMDESKQRAVAIALFSVLGSTVGDELLRENDSELVPFLLAGLCHPVPEVKTLTAKALASLGLGSGGGGISGRVQPGAMTEEGGRRASRCRALLQPPLLPALVATLGDDNTGAAQAVANTILALCEEADRPLAVAAAQTSTHRETTPCRRAVMSALLSQLPEVVAGLTNRQASTPKLRFADTAARLMSASDPAFNVALEVGALSLVTSLTEDASDVLLQLNALELLEQVASTAGGARHLVAQGHLDRLLVAAGGGDEPEAPAPLLGASALRTLAKVLAKAEGAADVDVWRGRSSSFLQGFLRACAVHIYGRDEAGKLAGLVAASTAAEASNEALNAMLSQQHGTQGVLDAWLTLSAHKTEVKAAALHAFALVLGLPTTSASPASPTAAWGGGGRRHREEDGDEVMGDADASQRREARSSLCRTLFERLGVCNTRHTAGALLLELARQPVPEIRHAAYDVLRCTVWQPGGWGLSAVFTQPGFRGFLMDRDSAASKATKEWKFSVVEAIMACKERAMLGEEALESFKLFLKQGPFWVPAKRRDLATAE